ncbi:C40 family peptidase [Hymenobacter psoromatis]|uniref:C40 family peptidase n=1 Tax=Hymenobacter psoromatis TaxID=1484116 RepID=UPI001CBC56FE|nr:C40 family peptidase [Hymenobacter psoromatis]
MRSIWLIFGSLLLSLLGLKLYLGSVTTPPATAAQPAPTPLLVRLVAERRPAAAPVLARPSFVPRRDSIVGFALRQVGSPYLYAGMSPVSGFDCSGFVSYVFGHFGVPTPHSTALLIDVGQPVPRAEAQPGDIVVFTGTAATSTTPGHAGIVISALGETPLRFVHASSAQRASGVKISQVEGSGYERRFMQVRRVIANE